MERKKSAFDFRAFNRKFKKMNDTDDVYGELLSWFDLIREEILLLKLN